MSVALERDVEPWYRQFWPWALMAGPAVVVVAGFVTLWFAVKSPDALVVDDYYKEGKAINAALHRDQKAAELGLTAKLHFSEAVGGAPALELKTQASQAMMWPPVLQVLLTHPVKEAMDRKVEMTLVQAAPQGATYRGTTEGMEGVAYQVTVQDPGLTWRLINQERGAAKETVALHPGSLKAPAPNK